MSQLRILPKHPPAPYRASENACETCGAPLWSEPCGCWTDCRGTRWCDDGTALHRPTGTVQPETCEAEL